MEEQFDQTKADILLDLSRKLKVLTEYQKYNQLAFTFPEDGPYARSFYTKHLEFLKAGHDYRFRMLSGGNGSGKSFTMGYEIALHASGQYPDWWDGKRLKKPRTIWIVAESGALFRDSLQKVLYGNPGEEVGTGLIPKDQVIDYNSMPGVPGAIGTCLVKHKDGHVVSIVLKTFDMRRENLQAATVDLVAFDEEPPEDVYEECIMRTRGTKTKEPGIAMMAFTPLKGLTKVVLDYLPNGIFPKDGVIPEKPDYYSCRIGWNDAPHLTEKDKEALLSTIAPNLRDARTKGIPALGSGRIYPVHEEDIVVNTLKIGKNWPRAYGLDFGWNCTAAVWMAKDPETGIYYIYGEYYKGQLAPYNHAYAIKCRGEKLVGVCDPRGDKSSERDGSKLIDEYTSLGLELISGDNAVTAGIARLLGLMEAGLLRVSYNCINWLEEFRIYRYDTKDPNKVARNQKDHLMDATRYLISRFEEVAQSEDDLLHLQELQYNSKRKNTGPDERNSITGY